MRERIDESSLILRGYNSRFNIISKIKSTSNSKCKLVYGIYICFSDQEDSFEYSMILSILDSTLD